MKRFKVSGKDEEIVDRYYFLINHCISESLIKKGMKELPLILDGDRFEKIRNNYNNN